ncbi:MAG: ATP-binding protein [Acetobacteraceae bacterium]
MRLGDVSPTASAGGGSRRFRPLAQAAMRAFAAVPPHRALLALALLAPVVLFTILARSTWIEAGAQQRARATDQLDRAQDEVAALVRLDQLALAGLRVRLGPPLAVPGGTISPPPWLSLSALPPLARREGGIVALFVADASGLIRPLIPAATLRLQPPGTLQSARFFERLHRGAKLAIGNVCPVAFADGLTTPTRGFVLAEPLDTVAIPPRRASAGIPLFQGAIGACVDPSALARTWHQRLGPAETLLLASDHGQTLVEVAGNAARPRPGSDGAQAEQVARTPLRVVFTPAPYARWQAWYPAALADALLSFVVGLALVAAAVATQRQRQTGQALAAAERFADVLRLSAERYRQLYLGAPAAMHALDPSWRIIAVTDHWLKLLGYRREEVLGRRFESFLVPAARPAAAQAWTRLLAGDQLPPTRRRLVRQNGTEQDVTLAAQAERDPDGRLRRVLVLLSEATAAPTTPEAGRPDGLARIAGGVAHDFNNLLMVVIGSLERLAAKADRPDMVRRLAGMALAAAERGAGLTAHLLAAAGRQPLRPELANPNRLLREAADAIIQTAGPKVEVQFLLSPVLDPARLDPVQFRAALLALVANAREAMPRGGRLSIETANLAGPTPQEGQIMISLSDTGAGMDAAVLARATEPFFTTRPPGKASGLGLSMAVGFARQSGGSLEIESELGIGSTIRLLLPRSADAAMPGDPDDGRRGLPGERDLGAPQPQARPGEITPLGPLRDQSPAKR